MLCLSINRTGDNYGLCIWIVFPRHFDNVDYVDYLPQGMCPYQFLCNLLSYVSEGGSLDFELN